MAVSMPTIKELFLDAVDCAHPGCEEPLVLRERGASTVVAEIAHIRSISTDGPRHDPDWFGDHDGVENLLLLCLKHHRQVDRHDSLYKTPELLTWKTGQVDRASGTGTALSDSEAGELVRLPREAAEPLAAVARLVAQLQRLVARTKREYEAVLEERETAIAAAPTMTLIGYADDSVTPDPTRDRVLSKALSPRQEQAFADSAAAVLEANHDGLMTAIGRVDDELRVLRMMSGGVGPVGAAIEVLSALFDTIDVDRFHTWADQVDVALSGLWSAARLDGR